MCAVPRRTKPRLSILQEHEKEEGSRATGRGFRSHTWAGREQGLRLLDEASH